MMELKPCPFCGGNPVVSPEYISCADCCADGPSGAVVDSGDKRDAWNRRADLPPRVKPLVWVAIEDDRGDGSSDLTGGWAADSEIGAYVIDIGWGSDCYYWSVQSPDGFDIGSDFDDLTLAVAAAQADYTARIIAALEWEA